MLGAIPAMLVMEDLVLTRASFELDDKDRLHTRSFTRDGPCVNALDCNVFREEVELRHRS